MDSFILFLGGLMLVLALAFMVIAIREKHRYQQKPQSAIVQETQVTKEFLKVLQEIAFVAEEREGLRLSYYPSPPRFVGRKSFFFR